MILALEFLKRFWPWLSLGAALLFAWLWLSSLSAGRECAEARRALEAALSSAQSQVQTLEAQAKASGTVRVRIQYRDREVPCPDVEVDGSAVSSGEAIQSQTQTAKATPCPPQPSRWFSAGVGFEPLGRSTHLIGGLNLGPASILLSHPLPIGVLERPVGIEPVVWGLVQF